MKKLILILILFFIISFNINAKEIHTFKHPSKVFTIDIPKHWGKGSQFKHDNRVFYLIQKVNLN